MRVAMGSAFDAVWNRIAEPNMERFYGITIAYNDSTRAEELEIQGAIVTRERQQRRPNTIDGWDVVTTRTARFATPTDETLRLDGTVTINGTDYSIENLANIEGDRTEMALVRVEIGELTRPGYRRD